MKSIDLRAELKETGYSSRQVSVREMPGAFSTSFILTVHDPNISILEIRDLTNEFKEIERDRNGDLMSGNTYITVSRNSDHPVRVNEIITAVEPALKQVVAEPDGSWKNIPIEVNGRTYYLNKQGGHRPNLSGPRSENFNRKTRETVIGSQGMRQIHNPADEKDPESYAKAFAEAAKEIAARIKENELDIEYIKRNAKQYKDTII